MRKKRYLILFKLQSSLKVMSAFKPKQSASRIHYLNNFIIVYTSLLPKIFLICIFNHPMYQLFYYKTMEKPKATIRKIYN